MSKIDANIGVSLGDVSRTPQVEQDRVLQRAQVQRAEGDTLEHQPVSADHMRAIVGQLKQVIEGSSVRKFTYKINEETNDVYLEIRDSNGELVRQMPSEEVLKLREFAKQQGLLFDGKA